ncbi:hypothetical protein SSBR45G_46910 [Bradyrhizobium sp. SSBR45G]|uniref:hypothetical protein n=1 Tax=unclassified Bradyrhizobium TaxID=2631580 RepID=UPI0023429B55|nr:MULTISPECIES: hypothetical protein [unclassified Bradyrhizobium]GLH79782.1 hypothetical protein SSBR45G_46910 [Bradyrhizobium sp. SSBR45G]GLH87099.1 hypothetical protein SSBR45R_45590 [Bradyrhizobium sp. SSBR45R]
MPYPGWQPTQGCLDNIKKDKGRICNDPDTHCYDTQDYTHKVCDCQDQFLGGCTSSPPPLPPGCCHYNGDSDIPSYDKQGFCYCCCSCFAYDTAIAYQGSGNATSFRAVQEFAVGDEVLVADASLTWQQMKLQYSSGAPSKRSTLVKIDYVLDGVEKSLLVTRSHLFLQPDGKLIRADRLMPNDLLVVAVGGSTPVVAISAGIFDKGVHHIATSAMPAKSVAGHLLNSNGIVTGDYALQISGLTAADNSPLMVTDHHKLPVFGTEAYRALAARIPGAVQATLAHVAATPAARSLERTVALAVAGFKTHAEPDGFGAIAGYTPSYASGTQAYFTDDQAWDIQQSPKRAPVGSNVGAGVAGYLVRLFSGMYPTFHFEYDERNDTPNAYAFEFFNEKYVVITGGLVRVNALTMSGIAAILAHCVARLQKLAPLNQDGYSCRTTADYASPSVLSYVFFGGLYGFIMDSVVAELTELFGMVSEANAAGSGDTCMDSSLACRLTTLQNSMQSMPMPECAGGPKDATLKLLSAAAVLNAQGDPEVTLTFSDAVDPATVTSPANYQFDPPVAVADAAVDAADDKTVVLHPKITKGVEYAVMVVGVTSADGHPLIRSQSTALLTLS